MERKNNNTKIFALWNMKGGVGKTTAAFNIGSNLASMGNQVLLIDLDEQSNLTGSYFNRDHRSNQKGVKDVVKNPDLIFEAIQTHKDLDILRNLNERIQSKTDIDRFVHAIRLVQTISPYNYIIIDCHPDFELASKMALSISDMVIVPILLDGFSRDNLNLVLKNLNNLANEVGHEIRWKIFCNRLRNQKAQREIYKEIITKHDYPMFNSCIRDSAVVGNALFLHKALLKHRRKSIPAVDFSELTTELIAETKR